MNKSDLSPRDTVIFGRPNGQKRLGVIKRLNAKSASLECEDGKPWRVSYGLIELSSSKMKPFDHKVPTSSLGTYRPPSASAPKAPHWKLHQEVSFGRKTGAIAIGKILKLNRTRAKVELTCQYNSHSAGVVFNVPFSMLTAVK